MIKKILKHIYGSIRKDRDYSFFWVSKEGRQYRLNAYNRQKRDGTTPLVSNPTIEEIVQELKKYNPQSILEVGCGWGRLMEPLSKFFNIEGCDVSKDMLELCDPSLKIFYWDIVKEKNPFKDKRWDIVFCRGVIMYLVGDQNKINSALKNMEKAANTAVILWEWPEVIERVNSIVKSEKIIGRPIKHLDE